MANINELSIPDDKIEVDYENIPEEFSGDRLPAPQPGTYLFELPESLANVWEVVERKVGKRVQAAFTGENTLTMHLPNNQSRPFHAWINNAEFPRGAEKIPVSDMQYLVRALDEDARPTTNKEFVDELSKHGGEKFKATVNWSAYCNPNKNAYFYNPETGNTEEAEGTPGCGENYYQESIPTTAEGTLAETFACACGATVRAFPRLRNFKPAA